jgi:6-phosphogluconolactonase (cycloisomerase 2 family)
MLSPRAWFPFGTISLAIALTACGGSGGGSFQQGPPPPQPSEFLYGSDLADVVVTEKLDSSTGALGTGTQTPGGNGATIAVNPAATFLYTSDASSNALDGYSIGTDGTLTALSGSPFSVPGNGGVFALAIDPAGKFVYAAVNNSGPIAGFSIGADGSLSAIQGSAFQSGTTPVALTVSPSGNFLYAVDQFAGTFAYSISSTSGALTLVSGSPFAVGIQSIAITPDGKYLYGIADDSFVYAYSIDGTTGALTTLSSSPFPTGSTEYAFQILVEPKGKFLYTYNMTGNADSTISALSIDDATGNLSLVTGSPFAATGTLFFAASLTTDPDGKFLYASCSSGSCGVAGFNIDTTTGALSPIAGSPFNSIFNIGRMAVVSLQ